MSDYERQTGKLKVVSDCFSAEDANNYCRNYYHNNIEADVPLPSWCDNWVEMCNDHLETEQFLFIGTTLWFVYDIRSKDPFESYCNINGPDIDNVYQFDTKYYNGGTYLNEMLEDKLKTMFLAK